MSSCWGFLLRISLLTLLSAAVSPSHSHLQEASSTLFTHTSSRYRSLSAVFSSIPVPVPSTMLDENDNTFAVDPSAELSIPLILFIVSLICILILLTLQTCSLWRYYSRSRSRETRVMDETLPPGTTMQQQHTQDEAQPPVGLGPLIQMAPRSDTQNRPAQVGTEESLAPIFGPPRIRTSDLSLQGSGASTGRAVIPRGFSALEISTLGHVSRMEKRSSVGGADVASSDRASADMEQGRVECVVCLGDCESGDVIRTLSDCGHLFHKECVDAWLAQHKTCPVCRRALQPPLSA